MVQVLTSYHKQKLIFKGEGCTAPLYEPYKYNHGHNILRLFNVLPNFHFPTTETNRDY